MNESASELPSHPEDDLRRDSTRTRRPRGVFARRGLWVFAILYLGIGGRLWWIQDHEIFKVHPEIRRTPAAVVPPIPFSDVEIKSPQAAVHGFWVPAPGESPVILFLHGQDTTRGTNLHQLQTLHVLGYHVLLIHYRGYGKTLGEFSPSEASLSEDAETAYQYLRVQDGFSPDDIVIYGHSLGGAVAVEMAPPHSDSVALVVENSFTSIPEIIRWKVSLVDTYDMDWTLKSRFDSLSKVPAKRLPPALFIHGRADQKVPSHMSTELYDSTITEEKRLLLLEGAVHGRRGPSQREYQQKLPAFFEQCQIRRAESKHRRDATQT